MRKSFGYSLFRVYNNEMASQESLHEEMKDRLLIGPDPGAAESFAY